MHPFSDSDTSDSEDGIRFKTQSTRKKEKSVKEHRRRSPEHRKESRRRRSRSRSRHRHRSRSRDRHRHRKHRRERDAHERQSSSRSAADSARPVKSHKQVPESSNDRVENVSSEVLRRKDGEGMTRGVKDDDAFGPSLPPKHVADGDCIPKKCEQKISADGDIGPEIKLSNVETIGPVLPASLNNDGVTVSKDDGMERADIIGSNEDVIGPVDNEDSVGPVLPTKNFNSEPQTSMSCTKIGPSSPLEESANSESSNVSSDECIGSSNLLIGPSSIVKNDTFIGSALLQCDTSLGPALLKKSMDISSNSGPSLHQEDSVNSSPDEDNASLGPALPPHLKNTDDSFGPSLPPCFSKTKEPKCIGPTLPAHLRERLKNNEEISEFGEEDDDDYGPLPVGANPRTTAHVALEERALQMKLDKLNPAEDGKPRREEWMVELPSAAARIGLGPRQFRAKEGPDMSDRSSWTDTPLDKEKKKEKPVDLKEEAELQESKRRDKEQEAIIKNHKKKKKRDKSLLEQHQEKIKKKKEEESSSGNVRRPFSRDIDLKVNHFDEAQKKAIFKKAQMLDDRFSKGQTKYL